ncbi:MAG TPA: BON domain-containing protein [Nitrospira sp.]|nr:BON domain-containing protein [Nitrospira sp.]
MHRVPAFMLILAAAAVGGCHTTATERAAQQRMEDASVSAAVQAKLTGDRSSNFTRVEVKSNEGVVSLTGVVPTAGQRARAEELARQVHGVSKVDNDLRIRQASD